MNLELHLVLDSIAAGGGGERNALNDLDLRSRSFSFKPTLVSLLFCYFVSQLNKENKQIERHRDTVQKFVNQPSAVVNNIYVNLG